MSGFKKWNSINKFSDVYKFAQKFGVEKIVYGLKIKLHGTNAAIRVENGAFVAQKRTSDIFVDSDNMGFAAFVDTIEPNAFVGNYEGYIIDGEWAGKGIQKSDAVSKVEKCFFVFAIRTPDEKKIFDPDEIKTVVDALFGKNQKIFVIPWFDAFEEVNFLSHDDCQKFIDHVTEQVDAIGKEDPYIKEVFGVDGPGEGLVAFPIGDDLKYTSELMFKAKTEIHSVNKSKKRNHVAPEKPEGIEEFVDMFFTEQRFEQMFSEMGGEADRKNTGQFLKLVMSDVHKESQNEIEVADFEWKDVPKYAVNKVKAWWFKECDKL